MKYKLLFSLFFITVLLAGIRLTPWDRVNWGKFEMLPGSSLTVTGQAKQQLESQVAHFNVSITKLNDDKQAAINQVNQEIAIVIQAIKDFGIPEKDIQTQNVSVYQQEPPAVLRYPAPEIDAEAGWRASNSLAIILRDIDQASALADLLAGFESTNTSGPRFALDDTRSAEADLLKEAIEDARAKAEVIAQASGRKLGKVLTVTEGSVSQPYPVMRAMEASLDSSATPIEPGSEQISKTVTVVFELK